MSSAASRIGDFGTALREAGVKINTALRELQRREDEASSWMQRFIYREIEQRSRTRGMDYWNQRFPGLSADERAERRIRRMLTRATVAGVSAAAGASTAEVLSIITEGWGTVVTLPLGLVSVGAEAFYTTALQIDLAFDLASIYGVPFAGDDVGEISTLLALALGVDLVREPTRHDKPAAEGELKPWRVMRQMQRADFSNQVSRGVLEQAVLRNAVPLVGILVSAAWNQVVLRRFARQVHTIVRQRLAIATVCRNLKLGDQRTARVILDGAWLIATVDGDIAHHEGLALAILIDSLPLPERIAVHEASFTDDEEEWIDRAASLDEAARSVLIDVLCLVASSDGACSTAERRFLRRVARTLGRRLDLGAVDRLIDQLRRGEAPSSELQRSLAPALAGVS
jgi:tellurite resistance protein